MQRVVASKSVCFYNNLTSFLFFLKKNHRKFAMSQKKLLHWMLSRNGSSLQIGCRTHDLEQKPKNQEAINKNKHGYLMLLPKDQEPHEQTLHITFTASHDHVSHPCNHRRCLGREPNRTGGSIYYQFIMPCNPILSLFSPYQGQNTRNS